MGPRLPTPLRSAVAVTVVALALLMLAIALARPQVAAIAAALLLGAALGRSRGGAAARAPGQVTVLAPGAATGPVTGPGEDPVAAAGVHRSTLVVTGGPVRVRIAAPHHPDQQALLGVGSYPVEMRTARTGPLAPLRVDAVALTPEGDGEQEVTTTWGERLVVEPSTLPVHDLAVPTHLTGLTGPHRSRRRGEGEDLHDIAPFATGDRLRSVDWRVTARLGTRDPRVGTQLYVRRRRADAEAAVVVVLDSRDDVGPEVATWAGGGAATSPQESTSLDLARQAAASYVRAAIERGDRAGFADLANRTAPVRPAGGRRQLDRIVQAIARCTPRGEPAPLVRAPQVTAGALLIVVSTFLDEAPAVAALEWGRLGHQVQCVDVLPRLRLAGVGGELALATRVLMLERSRRLQRLTAAGLRVRHWTPQ